MTMTGGLSRSEPASFQMYLLCCCLLALLTSGCRGREPVSETSPTATASPAQTPVEPSPSPLGEVDTHPLPKLVQPSLLVDKQAYTLTVLDQGEPVKRYRIALGRDPVKRKVCFDNASTPEGLYVIYNLQPEATFYRAYDIDYPNELDRFRYDFLQRHARLGDPGIGGEIQIHGQGTHSNWTFGCIALENEDMDELFSEPALGVGTPVVIVGAELTLEDLASIERENDPAVVERFGPPGPRQWEALGRFQLEEGLPPTCQFDARTARAAGL